MPKIIVKHPFAWAHFGYQREEFEPSDEPRDTTDECAAVAIREGWAVDADAEQAAAEQTSAPAGGRKARSAAPENKSA